MSRFKRFAHSLASGYVLLGANVLYTLASYRLANQFLSPAEFGLWALTTNIAQYICLLDLGMTGTFRILIDYKDRKDAGDYGSVIQTFLLVSLVQAFLIVVSGVGVAVGLVPVLHIPAAQQQEFVYLTIGQCVLLAGAFLSRIFIFLLSAHQRYDLTNYTQTAGFALGFGVLWLAFRHQQGVYSTLWAQGTIWIMSAAVNWGWSLKLRLFPGRGRWGRPTWSRFRELFKLGSDLFLYVVGFQILNASQTAILTRVLGLEASALWAVCTRAFTVVTQLIYRILDYSATPLAEMIVRSERARLYQRFRSIVILTASLAVLAGALFAVCNQPFVRLWLGGKYGWSPLNDALLAVLLVFQATARCHLGLVSTTKDIRSMRYIYLVEGTFFVGLALVVLQQGGITALLLCAIGGAFLFSSPYGFWRTSQYFRIPWKVPAFAWWLPSLRLACGLVPAALLVWWLTGSLPLRPQLVVRGAATGLLGLLLLLRYGLDGDLRGELLARAPSRLKPLLRAIAGSKPPGENEWEQAAKDRPDVLGV